MNLLWIWNADRVASNAHCKAFCCEFVESVLVPDVVTTLRRPDAVSSVRCDRAYWLPAAFAWTLVNPGPKPLVSPTVPDLVPPRLRSSGAAPGASPAAVSGPPLGP